MSSGTNPSGRMRVKLPHPAIRWVPAGFALEPESAKLGPGWPATAAAACSAESDCRGSSGERRPDELTGVTPTSRTRAEVISGLAPVVLKSAKDSSRTHLGADHNEAASHHAITAP
jgi:hypothetical protein